MLLKSDKSIGHFTRLKPILHCWSILYIKILLQFHDNSLNIMYCSQRHTYFNNKKETRCYFSMQNALHILFTATRVSENCQDNVLLHLGNNGYANASQSHVTRAMPTLFKIQASTLPQPITITPIFIRHPSRNDPFHSLPSNNPATQVTPYAINVHNAQRAETGTEAEGRKVILRNVDVQTVS